MNEGSSGFRGLKGTHPGCWIGAEMSGVLICFISGSQITEPIEQQSSKSKELDKFFKYILVNPVRFDLVTTVWTTNYCVHSFHGIGSGLAISL